MMKFYYVIPPQSQFQPDHQDYVWPPQNKEKGEDRGVEQTFWQWIQRSGLSAHFYRAEAAYCGIFWNRLYINVLDDKGQWGGGVPQLQEEIDRQCCGLPWFTVCEYDIRALQPELDLRGMHVLCASRRQESADIDIPLLSGPHPLPHKLPEKKWLASFLGNMETDGVRMQMRENLEGRDDCRLEHVALGPTAFEEAILTSYVALAPRGQGAQSYRMYEAMQMGVVPLYISDLDCRPFPKQIDWASCSLWQPDATNLSAYLDTLDKAVLLEMGQNAKRVYDTQLAYGKWCPLALREVEERL
jgi:hypothetical protein